MISQDPKDGGLRKFANSNPALITAIVLAILSTTVVVYTKKDNETLPTFISYPAWIVFTVAMSLFGGYLAVYKDA